MYVETFKEAEKEEKEDQTSEQDLGERWSWLVGDIVDTEIRLNTQQVLENAYNYMVKSGII